MDSETITMFQNISTLVHQITTALARQCDINEKLASRIDMLEDVIASK